MPMAHTTRCAQRHRHTHTHSSRNKRHTGTRAASKPPYESGLDRLSVCLTTRCDIRRFPGSAVPPLVQALAPLLAPLLLLRGCTSIHVVHGTHGTPWHAHWTHVAAHTHNTHTQHTHTHACSHASTHA